MWKGRPGNNAIKAINMKSCTVFFYTSFSHSPPKDYLIDTLRKTRQWFIHCLLPQPPYQLPGAISTTYSDLQKQAGSVPHGHIDIPLVRAQLRRTDLVKAARMYKQGRGRGILPLAGGEPPLFCNLAIHCSRPSLWHSLVPSSPPSLLSKPSIWTNRFIVLCMCFWLKFWFSGGLVWPTLLLTTCTKAMVETGDKVT